MIDYNNVSKEYLTGSETIQALRDVSLSVEAGEFCVLLGPSGCGKTTLLRMANRLVEPTSGTITIQGKNILDQDPVTLRRNVGYVIQGIGLFPHRTVAQNVATTLKLVGVEKNEIKKRVNELLELVRLEPNVYRDRYPADLSGGEAQRVGVARALANNPSLLLMDEPFGAIDPINRAEIQQEFLELQRTLGKTVILVTHDVSEAFLFGDRIALLQNGELVQHSSPRDLLQNPATPFVSDFFGPEAELLVLDSISPKDILTPSAQSLSQQTTGLPQLTVETSLKRILGTMIATGKQEVVITESGKVIGTIAFNTILESMKSTIPQQQA